MCGGVLEYSIQQFFKIRKFLRQMANNYNSSRKKYMKVTFITYSNGNKM